MPVIATRGEDGGGTTSIIGRDLFRPAFAWLAAAAFVASLGYFLYAYFLVWGVDFGSAVRAPIAPPALTAPPAPPAPRAPLAPLAPVVAPVLINCALFTAFALHHSLFARTRLKHAVRRVVAPALERSMYTAIASALFVLVCWQWQPVAWDMWRLSGAWRWLGFTVQAAGVVLTIIGARALDALDLAGVRQATRVSIRHLPLETGGLYGFVRHPLYFAWVLLVFGAPDMTGTRFTFAVVSTLYLALAIPFEERSLIETFGPEYASYRQRVRWRMVPWVY